MEQTRLGPNDIPAGDPGFMVVIEVDHPLSDLTPQRRTELRRSVDMESAHVEESVFGNARVVFHTAHCGWWDAGRLALRTEENVRLTWPTVGIEICRADVWSDEPFFDHEPHGLGALPDWCHRSDPRRHSTVIVEVEPEGEVPSRLRDSDLVSVMYTPRDARTSRSSTGRPQMIVEQHFHAASAAMSTAKPAISIGMNRSITRIRSVRSDVYRAEVSHRATANSLAAMPQIPDWHYNLDDEGYRYVVVTDLRVRLEGWSVESMDADETVTRSDFTFGAIWADQSGRANSTDDGWAKDAWEAPVEPGSLVRAFIVDGRRLEVDQWDSLAAWMIESLFDKPVGFIVEVGPSDYVADSTDDAPVVCSQVVVLSGGVLMLRRSRTELGHLLLADYSASGLPLDEWQNDGHFEDCTDGYLFTKDIRLVARSCIAWIRVNAGANTTGNIGCSYRFADELPRSS
ncbi:hypothetical protein [Rhodococcus sp. IEGM 1341]|uniref:hypothetical protein n=1 Tax=Rhodococcus sp. IEGM 1341 TaxID=3047090 RepID=UPI0024B7F1C7|nr:hypothetical protein [Rhodococcus sp. IEGM 1341]